MAELLELRREGLYCPAGDFYIDPGKRVRHAVVTHAHGDHARPGCDRYWTAASGAPITRLRLGSAARVSAVAYGEPFTLGRARVSLHPAGHILGSAQVRIEVDGEVWVASGDYKRDADPSCEPFEPVACKVFVTEATFALPQYHWPDPDGVMREIHDWWQQNRADGQCSVLFCYALGKAQRILAGLRPYTDARVVLHPNMNKLVALYRKAGIALLPTAGYGELPAHQDWRGQLLLVPPQVQATNWLKRFAPYRTAFASGWMQDAVRQQRYDRGFALSDHADWPGLLRTIRESGARRVLAMHGDSQVLVTHLREQGIAAEAMAETP